MSICFPQFILKVEFERSDFMIKSINEIIKELRVESGITQSELADKLGCKRQKIADWEREKASPSINDLIPLSKVFNVSIDYLMGVTDVKTTDRDLQFVCKYIGLSEKTIEEFRIQKELSNSIKKHSDIVFEENYGILCNGITAHDVVDERIKDFYMLSYRILKLLSVYSKTLNKVDDEIDRVLKAQNKEDIISSRNNIDNYIDVISGVEFSISQMAVKIANDFCCKEKQEFEEKVDTYYKTAPLKIQRQLEDGESNGNDN